MEDEVRTRIDKRWIWVFGIIIGAIAIASILSYLLNNERVRRYAESKMNSYLTGYTVHIGKANFNPIFFALQLRDVTLVQDENPNPPVAKIRRLRASLHWSELLRLRLVAEFLIDNPKIFMNLAHFRNEQRSPVPLKEKGWQESVQSIYPIKINDIHVADGEFTYVDRGPFKPLHATDIELVASNIRNIKSPENAFPSTVRLWAKIFGTGSLSFNGLANFLDQPHLSTKGVLEVSNMDLSYFEPLLRRNNLSVRSGTLSTRGNLEYTPELTAVNLDSIEINRMVADYIHSAQTSQAEKKRVRETASAAGFGREEPGAHVRIGALTIRDSVLGYTDRTGDPDYRLVFTDVSGVLDDFSNRPHEVPSTLDLRGKFMGSGKTRVTGTFRPESRQGDLALKIAIENTQMRSMNDLFRSAANVDIEKGLFSFYSEMKIRNGYVNGWVKPMFKDVEVASRKDKKASIWDKAYAGVVGALAKVLENDEQVATVADITGPLENPDASTMQIITRLVRNAWIKAILPGFNYQAREDSED